MATAQECSIYESIEVGGVEADELQSILQRVINDFKTAYSAFRGTGLSDDITNESNEEFPTAYDTFRNQVAQGDERIANILRRQLQKEKNIHFDTIHRVRLAPPVKDSISLIFLLVASDIRSCFASNKIESGHRSIRTDSF